MNFGMLWFDNSPSTLKQKVQRAKAYYEKKYQRAPELCLVHPSLLESNEESLELEGLTVRAYRPVLPGHLWIGVEDETFVREDKPS